MIENHAALRRELQSQGFVFESQTDTEVVAHLIARELESGGDLFGLRCSERCRGSRERTAWRS